MSWLHIAVIREVPAYWILVCISKIKRMPMRNLQLWKRWMYKLRRLNLFSNVERWIFRLTLSHLPCRKSGIWQDGLSVLFPIKSVRKAERNIQWKSCLMWIWNGCLARGKLIVGLNRIGVLWSPTVCIWLWQRMKQPFHVWMVMPSCLKSCTWEMKRIRIVGYYLSDMKKDRCCNMMERCCLLFGIVMGQGR